VDIYYTNIAKVERRAKRI